MSKYAIAALICLVVFSTGAICEGGTKLPEIRAMWIARWDMASPEACHTIVKFAKDYGFNTLVVQVRGRGDALYKSDYEPRSELLKDQSDDFDPLGMLLEEGHKAGLQMHAWINANFTWGSGDPPVSPDHIVNKHPDWLMRTNTNEVTMTAAGQTEGAYTCPSNEVFREFLKDIYLDVVRKYAVDGVHFDFIRYPSTDYCYCDRCLGKFKAEMDARLTPDERITLANAPERNAYTFAFPAAWDEFRRTQITKMVYTVYDAVKREKPQVQVSASVFPGFNDAYNHRFQDWKRWMKDKKLDILFPMAYSKVTETFAENVKDAVDSSGGIPVVAGIGSWQIPVESTIEKIRAQRELGTAGFCLFSWAVTSAGTKTSYLEAIQKEVPPLK